MNIQADRKRCKGGSKGQFVGELPSNLKTTQLKAEQVHYRENLVASLDEPNLDLLTNYRTRQRVSKEKKIPF